MNDADWMYDAEHAIGLKDLTSLQHLLICHQKNAMTIEWLSIYAARSNNTGALCCLRNQSPPNCPFDKALHSAYLKRNLSSFEVLLSFGADPFTGDYIGLSTGKLALMNNQIEFIQKILQYSKIPAILPLGSLAIARSDRTPTKTEGNLNATT